jgi:hypothetical protein
MAPVEGGWEAKYFCGDDWTTQIRLNRLSKSQFTFLRFVRPLGRTRKAAQNNLPDLPDGQISVWLAPYNSTRHRPSVMPPDETLDRAIQQAATFG